MDNHQSVAWQPTASLELLQRRADLLRLLRDFFYHRSVLEVETPLLGHSAVSDVHLDNFVCRYGWGSTVETLFLQTSPEYAMKRLLAAGSGSIYQISKAFRHEPAGAKHNPEFSLLEWYRLGYDYHQLMDEVDDLLSKVLATPTAKRISYCHLFESQLSINPLDATLPGLKQCAIDNNIHLVGELDCVDDYLDLLMSHCIEPTLGFDQPVFIYDYPASQSALAQLAPSGQLAKRFEVYVAGVELANGFEELLCAKEQALRFQRDNQRRHAAGLPEREGCPRLLAALAAGMPPCSGVALGIDRLLMVLSKKDSIAEVMSFAHVRS